MSRATVDLQSVRFFLGYGLIFIAQSILTILLAAVAMFVAAARAGGDLAGSGPVRGPDRRRATAKRSRPAMQEAQQRIAELTADAEENVSGVRVVKAFAQEDRQLDRFRDSVERVFDQQMVATRIQALLHAADQLPAEPRAGRDPARRRSRGDRRLAHARPVHRVLRLPADADLADAHARLHARRRAAGHRLGRADLPDPRSRARDHRPRGRPGAARWWPGGCRCAESA